MKSGGRIILQNQSGMFPNKIRVFMQTKEKEMCVPKQNNCKSRARVYEQMPHGPKSQTSLRYDKSLDSSFQSNPVIQSTIAELEAYLTRQTSNLVQQKNFLLNEIRKLTQNQKILEGKLRKYKKQNFKLKNDIEIKTIQAIQIQGINSQMKKIIERLCMMVEIGIQSKEASISSSKTNKKGFIESEKHIYKQNMCAASECDIKPITTSILTQKPFSIRPPSLSTLTDQFQLTFLKYRRDSDELSRKKCIQLAKHIKEAKISSNFKSKSGLESTNQQTEESQQIEDDFRCIHQKI